MEEGQDQFEVKGGRVPLHAPFSSSIQKSISEQDYVAHPKSTNWCISSNLLCMQLSDHPLLTKARLFLFRCEGAAGNTTFKLLGSIQAVRKCNSTSVYIITMLSIHKFELNKMKRDRVGVNPIPNYGQKQTKQNAKNNYGKII